MNFKKNTITIAAAAALALVAGSVGAQQGKVGPDGFILSSGNTGITAAQFGLIEGLAPPTAAAVTLETPEGNVQSFALEGDPDNCTITLGGIPAGTEVTGASWDLRIETLGGSWLSEVQFQFRSSDPGDPQINLTPSATSGPGTEDLSSNGVFLFANAAPNPIPNIPIGADGELRIEVVDTFDDNSGAADADLFNLPVGGPFGLTFACDNQAACDAATITGSGSCAGFTFGGAGGPTIPETTPVPVNNPWALGLLALILASLGFVAVRRLA